MTQQEFNRKVQERIQKGSVLLAPLKVRQVLQPNAKTRNKATSWPDFEMRLSIDDREPVFRFFVECKADSTPRSVKLALQQAKSYDAQQGLGLVIVPYLSPERLDYLEAHNGSGIDLCGNGIVVVPEKIYIKRSGQPNLYPTSRPLQNPYKGRSALVARMFLKRSQWESVGALRAAIENAGAQLSASQVSKAIGALQEEMIIARQNSRLILSEPLRLLDQLGGAWKRPEVRHSQLLRLPSSIAANQLLAEIEIDWAVTGESSVTRYTTFSQGGPRRIAVSDLAAALNHLEGQPETIRNFADVELCETNEPGFFFDNQVDSYGVRWASRLQTWLELQKGDARQQAAARDLQQQILEDLS